MVCRAWRESLRPLREAMILLRWGKRFRHGHGGVRPNPQRALEYFLKGAALGSAPAMVDAGVMYGEMGEKEKAMALYEKAAEVGHPVGQSNLGTCYLEADLPEKAVTWFRQAAESGYARAQYNLALCLHRGRGVECNLQDASGNMIKALVYFELAKRAGETAASNMRDLILQSLSQTSRDCAMLSVDKWRPLQFHH